MSFIHLCLMQSSDQNFSCVFFDFDLGQFSTEGVTTKSAVSQDGNTIIECVSNHLTSFAVLLNVNGVDVSESLVTFASISLYFRHSILLFFDSLTTV